MAAEKERYSRELGTYTFDESGYISPHVWGWVHRRMARLKRHVPGFLAGRLPC
jgi:lipid A disaccharide synthetase